MSTVGLSPPLQQASLWSSGMWVELYHTREVDHCFISKQTVCAVYRVNIVMYNVCQGIILVHDLTNRKSHSSLSNWLRGYHQGWS